MKIFYTNINLSLVQAILKNHDICLRATTTLIRHWVERFGPVIEDV